MKNGWLRWVVLTCVTGAAGAIWAEQDIAGAKDHPMLTRWPESFITEYRSNYDSEEFLVATAQGGEPERRRVEGDLTALRYFYQSAETQPSPLQLIRNYQNAIKAIGGRVAYERLPADGDGGETTLNVAAGGKDVWVKVLPDIFGAPTQNYQLIIVEAAAMAQVVSASALWDAINRDGFVTLYINFDTGKADLKADGLQAVTEIITLMQSNPTLVIGIEGHTDNVGQPEANKRLSLARAEAVMNSVRQGGVDGARMTANGFGQDSPIADNRSEAGRAKNRRVELVKK